MSSTVWKLTALPHSAIVQAEVPEDAEFLAVREQDQFVAIWYLCDPDKSLVKRTLAFVHTGDPCPDATHGSYIGTAVFFSKGNYVVHVFELVGQ